MVDNTFDRLTKRLNEKADQKERQRKEKNLILEDDKPIEEVKVAPPKEVKTEKKVSKASLIKLPSGNEIEIYQAYINPKECRIWEGNNRLEETRQDSSLEELKSAIEASGQMVPGFVRPIIGDETHQYEVIYGSRRFAACSELNTPFLALVGEVTDKDALIMMDAENNARKELSVYEKATSYKQWLKQGYFKSRNDLAAHLGVSPGWISKIQSILNLPDEVLDAFASKADIKILWAMELSKIVKASEASKNRLIETAIKMPPRVQEPDEVYHYLKKTVESKPVKAKPAKSKVQKIKVTSKSGSVICELEGSSSGKVKATFAKGVSLELLKDKLAELNLDDKTWEF